MERLAPLGSDTKRLEGSFKVDFKYVPKEGIETGKETSQRQVVARSIFSRPVEAFYFSIFLLGVSIIVGSLLVLTYGIWSMGLGRRFHDF